MVPPEYSNALADLELSYNLSENKFKAMLQVRVAHLGLGFRSAFVRGSGLCRSSSTPLRSAALSSGESGGQKKRLKT
jgi:hypothetical protein